MKAALKDSCIAKLMEKFLHCIEVVGNKIPEPMLLFVYLSMLTVILSAFLAHIGFQAVNPATHKVVGIYNLLSVNGFLRLLTTAVKNFTDMPALGMVLVCMLGVGMCEKSGLFSALLQQMVVERHVSNLKVVSVFIFACVMADAAGGTGFVVMPTLGAILFKAIGWHPIAGMCAAYASVSGAFASNLLVTSMDVVNLSFTEAAAKLVDPNIMLSPAINYYFSAFSVITLTIVSVTITFKIVQPRLGVYQSDTEIVDQKDLPRTTAIERNSVRYALYSTVAYIVLLLILTIPQNGILRDSKTSSLLVSSAPLMKSLPLLIALLFFIPGTVFGYVSHKFQSAKDIAGALGKSMAEMGSYIALIFFIAQFLKLFAWSNIGIIFAIKGAEFLNDSGFPISIVLILFVIMCAIINLVIGGASTKWAILSPVFVPMFMFLGYHPALAQMAYRIGDAITNPLCPTFAYFGMLISLAQKYDRNTGVGTMMANMFPYTMAFFISMVVQLLVWFYFQIPFGPGAPLFLN